MAAPTQRRFPFGTEATGLRSTQATQTPPMNAPLSIRIVPSLVLTGFVTACGGGGTGGGFAAGPGSASVEETLGKLGVATATSPRVDDQGQALEDYSPLGSKRTLERTAELTALGGPIEGSWSGPQLRIWQDWATGQPEPPESLVALDPAQHPWLEDRKSLAKFGASPQTRRAVAHADGDGNGLDELLAVYAWPDGLHLFTISDETGGYAQHDLLLEPGLGADEVALVAADVGGDRRSELILCTADPAGVRVAVYAFGAIGPKLEFEELVDTHLAGALATANLAAGNLDTDRFEEFVLTVNETDGLNRHCRYFVHDDSQHGFELLASAVLESDAYAGQVQAFATSDVAVGDIDGDLIDEVILAGLSQPDTTCAVAYFLAFALDDASHGFAPMGEFGQPFEYYGPCDGTGRMHFAHVNAGDVDGDGLDEVQLGHFIFDDWSHAAPFTVAWEMPQSVVMDPQSTSYQHYDRSTSAMVMGDFTGNARADVATWRQDTGQLRVFGLEGPLAQATFSEVGSIPMYIYPTGKPPLDDCINPILLAPNVDADSPVLAYDEGAYRLVFTEPIVIAALAAPPYKLGIGQNIEACSTAFGQSTSQGASGENSLNVSASASVGFKLSNVLSQSEYEAKLSVQATVSKTDGWAYETTKTVIYASGYDEDLVIVSCVPVDQYTYTVLSHPDPEMVGKQLVVSLPRELITLQVDREFYNGSLFPGAMRVDGSVFKHDIGHPETYSTPARKNQLLGQHGGLQKGPDSVGIGSGTTTQELEVYEEVSVGGALEIGFSVDVATTLGGVLIDYSIGVSKSSSLTYASGKSTIYSCTMGAIPGAQFTANQYLYGIFAYPYTDPTHGRQFQVVDYWVE